MNSNLNHKSSIKKENFLVLIKKMFMNFMSYRQIFKRIETIFIIILGSIILIIRKTWLI